MTTRSTQTQVGARRGTGAMCIAQNATQITAVSPFYGVLVLALEDQASTYVEVVAQNQLEGTRACGEWQVTRGFSRAKRAAGTTDRIISINHTSPSFR